MPTKPPSIESFSTTGRPLILLFLIICAASTRSEPFVIVTGSYFIISFAKKTSFIPAGINLCARLRAINSSWVIQNILGVPVPKSILTGSTSCPVIIPMSLSSLVTVTLDI